MLPVVPLQFGVPGGLELVVLLFSPVFWVIPIAAVVLIVYYRRRIDRNVQRLLEHRQE